SPSGAKLFQQHCAACHGNDLKGNGPAPPPFKEWSPDLTTLARRHGGQFPEAYVANVLRIGVKIPEHGPAEMPIWGMTFKESEKLSDAQITARIEELIKYIKLNQAK
ncbi:MAG: cytochrome c, partial [Candidatus Acidiferrales bacterium]